MHNPPSLHRPDRPGLDYTAVALYALRRLPVELRAMLQDRGVWRDIVAWALVAAVEGWRNGLDFRDTYNTAQRYIYVALKAEGFRRQSRKHGSAMMYVRRERNLEEKEIAVAAAVAAVEVEEEEMKNVKRIATVSPVFPLPPLHNVKGGKVPKTPGSGEPGWESKPVFKFKDTDENALAARPTPVVVFTSHEGPSWTGRGTVDRHVIRLVPITHFTPPDDLPLLVCLTPEKANVWFAIAEANRQKAEVLADTPVWKVLLIPVETVRRVLGG